MEVSQAHQDRDFVLRVSLKRSGLRRVSSYFKDSSGSLSLHKYYKN